MALAVAVTEAQPIARPRGETEEGSELDLPYKVILWNDPITPMQVVVLILKRVFRYGEQKATELMLAAHQRGKAVVWTGAREQAVRYSIQLGTAGLQSTVGRDA